MLHMLMMVRLMVHMLMMMSENIFKKQDMTKTLNFAHFFVCCIFDILFCINICFLNCTDRQVVRAGDAQVARLALGLQKSDLAVALV